MKYSPAICPALHLGEPELKCSQNAIVICLHQDRKMVHHAYAYTVPSVLCICTILQIKFTPSTARRKTYHPLASRYVTHTSPGAWDVSDGIQYRLIFVGDMERTPAIHHAHIFSNHAWKSAERGVCEVRHASAHRCESHIHLKLSAEFHHFVHFDGANLEPNTQGASISYEHQICMFVSA